MLGEEKRRHQTAPASLSFSTSSATLLTLTPALRTGGSVGLDHFKARLGVDAVIGGGLFVDRLFLRLHDVRQRSVARLVQAQIGGDDGRQLELHRLQAAVDFARHHQRVAVERDFGSKGALRPAEQRRQHLAGLIAVVVDRLLAEDDQTGLLGVSDGFEDFRHRQRLDRAFGLDQDAAVGAHGECGADGLGGLLRTDRDGDDLGRLAGFLEPDRFLDGDLVERIHRHFDVAELDAGAVGLDPDFHVLVDRPLHGHENFHCCILALFRLMAACSDVFFARCFRPLLAGPLLRCGKPTGQHAAGQRRYRFSPGFQSTSPAPRLLA